VSRKIERRGHADRSRTDDDGLHDGLPLSAGIVARNPRQ
jgi:hypothetical protein